MKKIILTEEQTQKLMTNVINEKYPDEDQFYEQVTCDFSYHGAKFKGGEINDILKPQFTITYNIDVDYRSYGIKEISVYNIQGPNEIEAEIQYYPPDSDDYVEDILKLRLNWDNMVVTNEDQNMGYIGVHQDIEIELINDEQGNLVAKSIIVTLNNPL